LPPGDVNAQMPQEGGAELQWSAAETPRAWQKVWGDDDTPQADWASARDRFLSRYFGVGDFTEVHA